MAEVQKLKLKCGSALVYKRSQFRSPASVVFFGGFMSNMGGTKASALLEYCLRRQIDCTLFDYLGHGQSDKEFEECALSDWLMNCHEVIESIDNDRVVVAGSSMGGWLMLLTAMKYPTKIKGLIGLAPAPDFTEDFDLSEEEYAEISKRGKVILHRGDCNYTITAHLITDGKNHLLLNRDSIPIECPIRLIHGMDDKTVDYQVSLSIAEKIKSSDVITHLIKSGDHYLSNQESLNTFFHYLEEIIQKVSL